jgi:hypothetical protein
MDGIGGACETRVAFVLTLILLGKLVGEVKVSGIAHRVRLRKEWVKQHLGLERDTLPCAGTCTYVLEHVDARSGDGGGARYAGSQAHIASRDHALFRVSQEAPTVCHHFRSKKYHAQASDGSGPLWISMSRPRMRRQESCSIEVQKPMNPHCRKYHREHQRTLKAALGPCCRLEAGSRSG